MKSLLLSLLLTLLLGVSGVEAMSSRSAKTDKVRLTWPLMPSAVYYKVDVVVGDRTVNSYQAMLPGLEIDLNGFAGDRNALAYTVRGLAYDGRELWRYSPQPLMGGERSPASPLPLYDLPQPILYPVYAWVPTLNVGAYELEVWRGEERRRHEYTYEHMVYATEALTEPGDWWWRVRALDSEGRAYSDWSPRVEMAVTVSTPIASFGDSITHGGGAVTVPPCLKAYSWQTYAGVAIKNLGLSGDTTADMLRRYNRDVRPCQPRLLVIMGGVNDYRLGVSAETIIGNLRKICERCVADGITPILATVTPINPELIRCVWRDDPPMDGWRDEQLAINRWIMSQPHCVDVATALTDANGELAAKLTTDGLHPDVAAKRIIGETIGQYLRENFPQECRESIDVHDR